MSNMKAQLLMRDRRVLEVGFIELSGRRECPRRRLIG
jgi:hypothetical protein